MVGCHQDDLLKRAKALQMKPRAGQGAPPTQTLCFSSVLSTRLRSPTSLLCIPRVKPACILLDQPPVLSVIRQQCRSENGESDRSSADSPPRSSLTKADEPIIPRRRRQKTRQLIRSASTYNTSVTRLLMIENDPVYSETKNWARSVPHFSVIRF